VAYFNYTTHWPNDWWARRSFDAAWWTIYSGDPRWTPPDQRRWHHLVTRMDAPYWQQANAQLIYLEALPGRRQPVSSPTTQPSLAGAVFEEAVAAAVLLCEPRHQGAMYLGMLHCVNDEETLDRLLSAALEHGLQAGCTRIVGPVGVIPAWENGVLTNYFHTLPPAHTPYNPPYLADLLATSMSVHQQSVLLTLPVAPDAGAMRGPATLTPLDAPSLGSTLLPLLTAALVPHVAAPTLDANQATLLLEWIGGAPTVGWVAHVDGEPAGFVALQPDLAPLMHRFNGGRRLPMRWLLALAKRRPVRRGRLLFGAVGAPWRRQGIGRQLMAQALHSAASAGWCELICGPFVDPSPAVRCLQQMGASAEQRYTLFEWSG
jgi:GNAT superfamily N-acetyltransferase